MDNQSTDPVECLLSFSDEVKRDAINKRVSADTIKARANDLLDEARKLEQEASGDDDCEKRHRLVAVLVRGISLDLRRAMRQRRDGELVEPVTGCPHSVVLEYRLAGRQCLICQLNESSVNGQPFPNLGDSRERYVHQQWNLDRPIKPVSWPRLIAWLTDDNEAILQIFTDTGLQVDCRDE
jgi:hypothetical protein